MAAPHALLTQVYDELRKLAADRLAGERPGLTLSATALVHEAYLRIGAGQLFENRGHFFAAAAEAMRRILIEAARRRQAAKRGGDRVREHRDLDTISPPEDDERLLAMQDALARFEAHDPEKAEVVKLRYFVGLSNGEVAELLGVSLSTVERHWAFARAWLKRAMTPSM